MGIPAVKPTRISWDGMIWQRLPEFLRSEETLMKPCQVDKASVQNEGQCHLVVWLLSSFPAKKTSRFFTFIVEGPWNMLSRSGWRGLDIFRWWSPAQIDFKRCVERLAPSIHVHTMSLWYLNQRPPSPAGQPYHVIKISSWWFEPAAWLWGRLLGFSTTPVSSCFHYLHVTVFATFI